MLFRFAQLIDVGSNPRNHDADVNTVITEETWLRKHKVFLANFLRNNADNDDYTMRVSKLD